MANPLTLFLSAALDSLEVGLEVLDEEVLDEEVLDGEVLDGDSLDEVDPTLLVLKNISMRSTEKL